MEYLDNISIPELFDINSNANKMAAKEAKAVNKK